MFETDRLFLRQLKFDDAETISALRSDPLVMKYSRGPQTDIVETRRWISLVSSKWESAGIGYCGLVEKKSEDLIGWCGLWKLRETGETEIGYAINPQHWNSGYATEATCTLLNYAFRDLALPILVAVCYPDNKASKRVMEKLGMKFAGIGYFYGAELAKFTIEREEWQMKNQSC